MPVVRRFLFAPPLARLVQREYGSERVIEGHFFPHSERQSHVRIEDGASHLILTSCDAHTEAADDVTGLPRLHAEALLEASAGRVEFHRSRLGIDAHQALVDRLVAPVALDIVSVEFATVEEGAAFLPPEWFGTEVTQDDSYSRRSIALSGLPHNPEMAVSDAGLNSLLDIIEALPANGSADHCLPTARIGSDEDTFDALRHLAALPQGCEPVPGELLKASQKDVAEPNVRRPVMRTRLSSRAGGDERIVSVLKSLSDALGRRPTDQSAEAAH
jgi:CYTH domain-containing protein